MTIVAKYNPFNPNSVVVPNLFAGRFEQVDQICKKLSQLKYNMPSSFFIYGERGIGKTALAKLINFIATSSDKNTHNLNLLTSYYSVEKGQSVGSVIQESLNRLSDQMGKDLIDEIGSRVGELFKNGKFQIGAFGSSISLETKESKLVKEISIKDQTVSILANIVKSMDQGKPQKKDGVLIIIDEVHNLEDLPSLAAIIRNIVTSLDVENIGKVAFLLIGYEEDVDKFFSEDFSARRTFDLFKLEIMPNSEAIEVLRKGFTAAKLAWNDQLVTRNVVAAGGYPHSIQILGHNIVEVDNDESINQEDWKEALIKSAFELRTKEFSQMYKFNKQLTQSDLILIELAKQNKPLSRKEIAELTGIPNVYQHFTTLKNSGAIKEDEGKKIHLQSQLLRTAILMDQYLQRKNILKENLAK